MNGTSKSDGLCPELPDEALDLDNPEFRTLWQLVNYTRQSVFLTGKAGTGKSTFLRYICSKTKKKHVILAPTGIAAVNAGGVTIHSFFKLPLKPLLPDDPDFSSPRRLRDRMKYNRRMTRLLRELELIIIDEISMVRADTIDFIDKLLRTYCGNSREPFAGKQLLLVGDIFQLEPVVTSDAREVLRRYYANTFFFNATVFRNSAIVPIELRKVYRQNDQAFIEMLDRIRAGRPTESDMTILNSRVCHKTSDDMPTAEFTMTLASRRDIVDHINERHLASLRTPEHTYTGVLSGDFPTSSLPTPLDLVLKTDAQIVFIKNNPDRLWVNGSIGRITACYEDAVEV
ncbi:MAG: AAA family ATPase [Muribaculaceae bacterium]|nr:AAA family ATPase [Muribaculaceae bacterium]